jgi:hypothetical protein
MATLLGRKASRAKGGEQEAAALPLDPGFLEDFDALVRSRIRALFFYGRNDPEYRTFLPVERALWPELPAEARQRMTIEVWDGDVHDGTLEMKRQREILEHVLEWISSFHPRAAATNGAATVRTAS